MVDEAQQVGGAASKRLGACMGLTREHSWLVSGTPFDSLHTLLSQLKFLKVTLPSEINWQRDVIDVWAEQDAVSGLYSTRAQAAHSLVSEILEIIMVRHSKDQVDHQILLEPTENHTLPIDFVQGSSHELIYRCMVSLAEVETARLRDASQKDQTLHIRELSLVATHPSTINLASLALRLPRLHVAAVGSVLSNVPQLTLQQIVSLRDPAVRKIVRLAPDKCMEKECQRPFAPATDHARIVLMCGHSMCKNCVNKRFEDGASDSQQCFCPECNANVKDTGLLNEVVMEPLEIVGSVPLVMDPPDATVLEPLKISVCDSAAEGGDHFEVGKRAGCEDGGTQVRLTQYFATMPNGSTLYFCKKACATSKFARHLNKTSNDQATRHCKACSKCIIKDADLVICTWRAKLPDIASGKLVENGDLFFKPEDIAFCKALCAKTWFQGPFLQQATFDNFDSLSGRPLYHPGLYERDNLREVEAYTGLTLRAGGFISKNYSEGIMQFPGGYLPGARTSRGAFLAHFDRFGQRSYGLDNGPLESSPKIDMLMQQIRIMRQDETNKCLIFSQSSDVLNVVMRMIRDEYGDESVRWAASTGGSVDEGGLETWRAAGCWGLLLTSQAYSAGLTLTEANYCFMMEPQPRLRDELQIFGRICRIGQTRDTHKFCFYMRGTCEEEIIRQREAR